MKKIIVSLCIFSTLIYTPALAESVPQEIVLNTQKNVFEVVIPKAAENEDFKYERKITFDHLPFVERQDKYHSIGTAFLIANNTFVTAAHVLDLGYASLNNVFYIRDHKKRVYKIKKITKYSEYKDLAVFKVRAKKMFRASLRLNKKPVLHQTVYAVGNALGEGVIIREGTLTSKTPEEWEGEWKWLRFSAAASPGNSGGPLLDKNGDVIGIVLRKSPNENLNYALPIKEVVKQSRKLADVKRKIKVQYQNMNYSNNRTFEFTTDLPKTPKQLRLDLTSAFDNAYKRLLFGGVNELDPELFPNTDESKRLLESRFRTKFPSIISQDSSDEWTTYFPSKLTKYNLPNEGEVTVGKMWDITFFKIKKPDNIKTKGLLDSPKKILELLYKTGNWKRELGKESFVIKSLGKPGKKVTATDRFRRPWFLAKWDLPFNDSELYMIFLPTARGVEGMLVNLASKYSYYHYHLFHFVDYYLTRYTGTIKEWKEFQNLGLNYLPAFFSPTSIYETKNGLTINTPFAAMSLPKTVFHYDDNSEVAIDVWPMLRGGRLDLYPYKIVLEEDSTLFNDIVLYVQQHYPDNKKMLSDWKHMKNRVPPFDSKVIEEPHKFYIQSAESRPDSSDYISFYVSSSTQKEAAHLSAILRNVKRHTRLKKEYPYGFPTRESTRIYHTARDEKQYDEAIASFNRLITLSPTDSANYLFRGSLYESNKQNDLGLKDYITAFTMNPNDQEALTALTFVYYEKDNMALAKKYIKKAVDINLFYKNALLIYSMLLVEAKDIGEVQSVISMAQLNGMNPYFIHHLHAESYILKKKYGDAEKELQKIISDSPGGIKAHGFYDLYQAHYTLAQISAINNDEDGVFNNLENAFEMGLTTASLTDGEDELTPFLENERIKKLIEKYEPARLKI